MGELAKKAFLILEYAWTFDKADLADFKVEFGIDSEGNLLIADVIDNDSWRLLFDGKNLDKQVYRDGGALETVLKNYELVARLTELYFGKNRDAVKSWYQRRFIKE